MADEHFVDTVGPEKKLTAKQEQFCQEYIIDFNAAQAAIRAGYSEDTAKQIGYENLTKPYIQEYLQELKAKRAEKTQISQERVLQEYARLGFSDIRKLYDENGRLKDVQDLDDDTAAAISSIEVNITKNEDNEFESVKKYKMVDKKGALDSVARHLGMFNDSLEVKLPTVIRRDLTGKK